MTEKANDGSSRRLILASAAAGTAAGVAGLAAGLSLGQAARPARPSPSGLSRFAGKVVLITGATSGIGHAAAKAFAAEGAKVAFCGRREQLGRDVEAEIRWNGGEATYIRADVRVESDVKAFVDGAVAKYGRLDVAFNNAGITLEKPLHELTAAEFDDVAHTNLRGVFLAIKYQVPHMIAAGGGSIVVTASSNAIATQARRAAYSASKRALIGLVQRAALDYAAHGIRVNALVPGTTDTALVRRAAGMENVPDSVWRVGAAQWAKSNVPGLGRMATAEEIAAFALVLASDEHAFMTGAALVIDGGKTAHA
ncbi:SDR family NAD(P)-dependent oxidoreductase [Phreatobacter stygius]|uniref:SDR family oxidoreductase n=1 Tax=Phreatobacter stygius TaxID=1940610 RepID=A0A4D7B8A9_9HYPH|nr:SDR family NAD(P)-dependent oxidoreductase [Phreatobacter stygius]QCI66528.1 SDR family oxidoreductase [Phreatobacter stygius]